MPPLDYRQVLAAYAAVMGVAGGNSTANAVSVTPGGVSVNQATNVAALPRPPLRLLLPTSTFASA